jgi:transposase
MPKILTRSKPVPVPAAPTGPSPTGPSGRSGLTCPVGSVVGGVDTHADTHTVAVVDAVGRSLGHAVFPATADGYRDLTGWLTGHGPVHAVGVEGTGSYGAGLTRWLTGHQVRVVEVNRPDRAERRRLGKSDPIDAVHAAVAVLAGKATAVPKTRTGPVEVIRIIHTTRETAVKARTGAVNSFVNLARTSPDEVRDPLTRLTRTQQLDTARRYRAGSLDNNPTQTAKRCLRRLAERIRLFDQEIKAADRELDTLTQAVTPRLRAETGVGPEAAAQLLITAGDNPDRIHSEAAFAALCGTSPVLASSGRSHHHRLNRGGDRQANRALHMAILSRLSHHQPTRDYITARTTGRATPALTRPLKRYLARRVYHLLIADLADLTDRTTT